MAKENKDQSTELATAAGALVAPSFIDESLFGQGFEGMGAEDYAIPFLAVLQKMSPMVDEDGPAYVEGAKAGMLINTVTNKLYDGKSGIQIVPCAYKRSFIQWGGRESSAPGFKGEHAPEAVDQMKAEGKIVELEGKLYVPNEDGTVNPKKNDLIADTRSYYVIAIDPTTGERSQAIMSMSSTQIKAAKALSTQLSQRLVKVGNEMKTPPMFANVVRATTISQSNDKGSWSGLRFECESIISDPSLFDQARKFYKAIVAGEVKVDHAKNADNAQAEAASSEPQDAEQF